ncbi:MAG TPA: polysaccharide deacetylase family protein [Feifaniaceae bacterium]|nr:polysaccharide deacetylase family protein [Feifaniaceae bacterium]
MKRGLALICVLALLATTLMSAAACADGRGRTAKGQPQDEATRPLRPTQSHPIPPPTPEPTSVPHVEAEWYVERNNTLRRMLAKNGDFAGTKEIDQAIEKMVIDPDKPMVALTFDDGPKPGVTDEILDVLEEYNVRATFFIVGIRLNKPEEMAIVKRAISLGCEIGNHTWTHDRLTSQNLGQKRFAIRETNKIVFDATGYQMRFVRPPGGYYDPDVCRVAKEEGMAVAKWAQSGNVMERDPKLIAQNVQKQIVNGKELQDGDIVLLHDTKPYMVDAVKIIIPQLLEQGYQLVTVWELINCSDAGFIPGEVYHHQ